MKAELMIAVVLPAVIACVSSCSEAEWTEPYPGRGQIVITDSIGIETGDSCYVLGAIADASFTPSGTILILDGSACTIREFSETGEFLGFHSRMGSGPGELSRPAELMVMPDGRMLVSSAGKQTISVLSPDGTFQEELTDWPLLPPFQLAPLSGNRFVGCCVNFNMRDEDFVLMYSSSVFSVGNTAPEFEHQADTMVVNGSVLSEPMSPNGLMGTILITSDTSERVFYSRKSSDRYLVTCRDVSGELLFTVSLPLEPVEKTSEVMIKEEEYYRMILGPGAQVIDLYIEPCYNFIEYTGIDSMGNLWVQRGTESIPVFDVFNTSGEHTATVEFPCEGRFWKFSITPYGSLAWDTDPQSGIQRLYSICLPSV